MRISSSLVAPHTPFALKRLMCRGVDCSSLHRAVAIAACPAPSYESTVNGNSPGTIANCASVCWTPPPSRPDPQLVPISARQTKWRYLTHDCVHYCAAAGSICNVERSCNNAYCPSGYTKVCDADLANLPLIDRWPCLAGW